MSQASVLVVEDNELERQITADTLRDEGFAVEEAPIGKRALELLGLSRFDVVLTDLMMPGMSGEQLVKAIRTDHSYDAMPIVVMSAVLDVRITSEIPADVFLAKPFALEPLVQILDRFACRALH